jgi:pimeloyl-ACP methyl ester carboxylesterase
MLTRLMDAASRTMPRTTARAAAGLMLLPGRRMRVRAEQREVMRRARRDDLTVGRRRMAVYRWGAGERKVLLVHGWSGRAAQFADLVARLESDATVVAFDAPGHGASRGSTADIGMWIEAIRALDAAAGGFDVVVGHSFGGLAALRARCVGLMEGRVVSISAPPSTDAVMQAYAAQTGLSDAVTAGISAALAHRLGPVMAAIAMGSGARARTHAPGGSGQRASAVWSGCGDRGAAHVAPLLVVHDRADRVVPVVAARAIEAGWPGPARVMITEDRGHNRILAAPEVLAAVAAFAADPDPVPEPIPVPEPVEGSPDQVPAA